jgi:hypothetical protein
MKARSESLELTTHLGIEIPKLFNSHEAKDVIPLCRPLIVGEKMYRDCDVALALARITFRFEFYNIHNFYGEDIRALAEPGSGEMRELVVGIKDYFTMMLEDTIPELREIGITNLTHLARICSIDSIDILVAQEIADLISSVSLDGQEEPKVRDYAFREFVLLALDPLDSIKLVADLTRRRLKLFPSSTIRIILMLMETSVGCNYYQKMRYDSSVIDQVFDYIMEDVEGGREFLREGIEESQVSLTKLGNWGGGETMLMPSLPFADSVMRKLRELVAIAYDLDMRNEIHMRLIERFVR